MKPKARTVNGLLQLRYVLPHNVHVSAIYPLHAPNGSQIVVCGHGEGLLVVWRGGRPFRSVKAAGIERANGRDVMIVDDSDDETSRPAYVDEAPFENDDEELDPSTPYASIVQHLDIPLGTGVLHLSFPRLPASSRPATLRLSPPMLLEKMVVAVACTDATVRLLSLPLTPPSQPSKDRPELLGNPSLCAAGQGSWGEQLITVPNSLGHQSLPGGVALAFATLSTSADDDAAAGDGMEEDGTVELEEWHVLVASHSADLGGTLLIHKIPVSADGLSVEPDTAGDLLWRKLQLPSLPVSVDLHITATPDKPSRPQILVADANGPVRIYECCTESSEDEGAWSAAFYPGFVASTQSPPHHRSILYAAWVLDGKAVAVLTGDGEWGIWNVSVPKVPKAVAGSIPTKFALNGWIGGSAASTNLPRSSSGKAEPASQMAPMTPHTRKVRQDALFASSALTSETSLTGGISVTITGRSVSKGEDSSLVIWYGGRTIQIPSLSAYWASKSKSEANPFGSGASGQIREFPNVDIRGEARTSISAFLTGEGGRTRQPDLLVSGERSFTVLASAVAEPRHEEGRRSARPAAAMDQALLRSGELGVAGLDRVLNGMADGGSRNGLGDTARRVLFASSS